MPIVGPLREFGVQDVFQLLALSRKTGVLTLTAPRNTSEGFVVFEAGRVTHAGFSAEPTPAEDVLISTGRVGALDLEYARRTVAEQGHGITVVEMLVEAGAISQREVERVMRQQVESVVFELMTWRDGQFAFEERPAGELPRGGVALSTEGILMESARRLDEWSNIAQRVPDGSAVAQLVPVEESQNSRIDLRPHEWLVLGMIDGERDVRAIATMLSQPVFDVAKVVYGLAMTGLVAVRATTGSAA